MGTYSAPTALDSTPHTSEIDVSSVVSQDRSNTALEEKKSPALSIEVRLIGTQVADLNRQVWLLTPIVARTCAENYRMSW